MSALFELGPVVQQELRTLLDELLRTHFEAFREQLRQDSFQTNSRSATRIRTTTSDQVKNLERNNDSWVEFLEGSQSVKDMSLRRAATVTCGDNSKVAKPSGLPPRLQSAQIEEQKEAPGTPSSGWTKTASASRTQKELPTPMMSTWMDANWHSYKAKEFLNEMNAEDNGASVEHTNSAKAGLRKSKSKSLVKGGRKGRKSKHKQYPKFQRMTTWHSLDRPQATPTSQERRRDSNESIDFRTCHSDGSRAEALPRMEPLESVGKEDIQHISTIRSLETLENDEQELPLPGALPVDPPEYSYSGVSSGLRASRDSSESGPAKGARFTVDCNDDSDNLGSIAEGGEGERSTAMRKGYTIRSLHTVTAALSGLRKTTMNAVRSYLRRHTGDVTIVILLIMNALWMGVTSEYLSSRHEDPIPLGFRIVDWIFCAIFFSELALRIFFVGFWRFWSAPDWRWNVFDSVLVGFNVVEEIVQLIVGTVEKNVVPSKLAFMRILRILRLARALRLLRVVHHVRELHTMVCSIAGAFRSFLWTLVLFIMILYVASVYFGQLVLDFARSDPDEFALKAELSYYFGSVSRSFLTLYQSFTGGIDWDNAINPVIVSISTVHGVVFSLYIAFSVLVMMNVVTAVFVDAAQKATKEDKDIELVNQVRELFMIGDQDAMESEGKEEISWEEFQLQLTNPRLEEYFKAIDLDLSEAKGLFDLLDSQNRGFITAQDFVLGCLRLTGPAKAIDLATLMKENSNMFRWLVQSICIMYEEIGHLGSHPRSMNGVMNLSEGRLDSDVC